MNQSLYLCSESIDLLNVSPIIYTLRHSFGSHNNEFTRSIQLTGKGIDRQRNDG